MSSGLVETDPEQALYEIQRLQFSDLGAANRKLTGLFRGIVPFALARAEIIPRAVSLNSMSGSLISEQGEEFFFKTHVESDSVLREYYNVELLQEAGYPIIAPIFAEQTPGRQIVVYPYIRHRTVFDEALEADLRGGDTLLLMKAQTASDRQLLDIYRATRAPDRDMPESPVHQLFYYRITGQRFRDFYSHADFMISGQKRSFAELLALKWTINGKEYEQSLGELIDAASSLLNPQLSWGDTVVGHGDAHNGNFFHDQESAQLIYFDPAFAGRHSPWLDLVKPLFHNIFATWMYHPEHVASGLTINHRIAAGRIEVDHDYVPSKLRRQMLESKLRNVLHPLFEEQSAGSADVRSSVAKMRSALLCCPLLTVNLADRTRYPDSIALLALSQCVELASRAKSGTKASAEPFAFLAL